MKRNLWNIFLGVALSLMSGLLIWLITLCCQPIYFNTKYTGEMKRSTSSTQQYEYTFCIDGTYKCVEGAYGYYEPVTTVGIYKVIEDRIYLKSIGDIEDDEYDYLGDDSAWVELKISKSGKTLTYYNGSVFTAEFNKIPLYAILVALIDLGLIVTIFVINKKCS